MLRKRLDPLTFFYEGVFMVTFSEHERDTTNIDNNRPLLFMITQFERKYLYMTKICINLEGL